MDGRFPKLKAGFFSKKRIEWASSGEFLCFPEFVHEVLILEKDQQYVKSFFSLGFSSNAVVCTFILEACSSKGELSTWMKTSMRRLSREASQGVHDQSMAAKPQESA